MKNFKITLKNLKTSNFLSIFKKYFTNNPKQNVPNFFNAQERLQNKSKNLGANTDQIQNYEKHILTKKKEEREINFEKDLENLFDSIESTNSTLLKNINNAEQTSPRINEISFDEYLSQSDRFFNVLKNAFQNLIVEDQNISLEFDNKHNLSIRINVKNVGLYIIAKEFETKIISVTSPISGLFKYRYDSITNYWRSTKDSHILEELLIREFCVHSKGLLIINNS